jgi:NodT family efflux transporter outer membrane factor (OMF) lipoprotein
MRLFKLLHIAFAIVAVLLSSCSKGTHTDYLSLVAKDHQQVDDWSGQEEKVSVTSLNDLISSPELEELITEALTINPGLQQTMLTLQILRAEHRIVAADRLPQATLDVGADKTQDEEESYSGSLTIGWEVDLWQKIADSDRAAVLDVTEQQALLQAARDTLAAEVMKEWLGLISDQRAIGIEQRRLRNLELNERSILQRYRSGLGTLEDLDNARSSTAVSSASLEEFRETLAQRQRNLKTILGRIGAADITTNSNSNDSFPVVISPLADLPQQTLQRRPDLKAAYSAIEAADLRISVAYKDLLPSISLEAAIKDIGDSPKSMLFIDPVWALLGQLTAPLFQGGKLRSAAEKAEYETAQKYQAYRETLLTAINEVENSLGLEQSLTRRIIHIETALVSARNSQTRYEANYRAGLVDILDLLSVQEETFDIEAQLDNLLYERLVNRIELGLALGLGAQ